MEEPRYATFVDREGQFNYRYYIPVKGNEEALKRLESILAVMTETQQPSVDGVSCWLDQDEIAESYIDSRCLDDRRKLHRKMQGCLSKDFSICHVDELRGGRFYWYMVPTPQVY
jgi:hypothetical protein